MNENRENLLCLLRESYSCEQDLANLLAGFPPYITDERDISARIRAFVMETFGHRALLLECLSRIEDTPKSPTLVQSKPLREQYDESTYSVDILNYSTRAWQIVLVSGSLLRSAAIEAEASGFFETGFVCEKILAEKSLMEAWLKEHLPIDASGESQ